ncbi:hypothetical protein MMC25_005680 [Agyrium rufum]|nr:hypothetical protein [Agyrium rufum]
MRIKKKTPSPATSNIAVTSAPQIEIPQSVTINPATLNIDNATIATPNVAASLPGQVHPCSCYHSIERYPSFIAASASRKPSQIKKILPGKAPREKPQQLPEPTATSSKASQTEPVPVSKPNMKPHVTSQQLPRSPTASSKPVVKPELESHDPLDSYIFDESDLKATVPAKWQIPDFIIVVLLLLSTPAALFRLTLLPRDDPTFHVRVLSALISGCFSAVYCIAVILLFWYAPGLSLDARTFVLQYGLFVLALCVVLNTLL